ncbi:hypothetical protein AMTRI_Chr01g132230 [Amborella trichopoda]|uniref:Uncharacterized protein n=1 Tax=Amborella trichopoda TaxID=13333 RepID=W1NR88_AMBTC|nr:hypothetical protein AMTR_s00170p00047640 [Amborella trichopoda]
MAGLSVQSLVILIFVSVFFSGSTSARLLVENTQMPKSQDLAFDNHSFGEKKDLSLSSSSNGDDTNSWLSSFLSALPKGTVPVSGPSGRGHRDTERVLISSVPSPGVGH